MPIEFNCGVCQQTIRVPDEAAAQQSRCPFCSHVQQTPPAPDMSANPYSDRHDSASPIPPPPVNPYAAPIASSTPSRLPSQFGQFNLAGRGERFLGMLVDFGFRIACWTPGIALGIFSDQAGINNLDQVAGALFFFGWVAYSAVQWTLIARTSQSVGKRVLKTKIVRLDGSPPGFVHGVILRIWAIAFLTFPFACLCYPITLCITLGDGLFIFGERCQCLHDMIASTVVVVADDA